MFGFPSEEAGRIRSKGAFARMAGIAPLQASSGITRLHRRMAERGVDDVHAELDAASPPPPWQQARSERPRPGHHDERS